MINLENIDFEEELKKFKKLSVNGKMTTNDIYAVGSYWYEIVFILEELKYIKYDVMMGYYHLAEEIT